jgi:hypothetical protein
MHFHDMIFLGLALAIIVLMLGPGNTMGFRWSLRDSRRVPARVFAVIREDRKAAREDTPSGDSQF